MPDSACALPQPQLTCAPKLRSLQTCRHRHYPQRSPKARCTLAHLPQLVHTAEIVPVCPVLWPCLAKPPAKFSSFQWAATSLSPVNSEGLTPSFSFLKLSSQPQGTLQSSLPSSELLYHHSLIILYIKLPLFTLLYGFCLLNGRRLVQLSLRYNFFHTYVAICIFSVILLFMLSACLPLFFPIHAMVLFLHIL